MNILEQAIQFAVQAHDGQIDEDGLPHIVHCFEVFRRVTEMLERGETLTKYTREDIQIAAILHDTVEDSPATLDQIEELFGKNVRDIVDSVSRRVEFPGKDGKEAYRDFIYRAQKDEGGVIVKIADLNHNYSRSHKIKKASWRDKLEFKYSIALRVLDDLNKPTWEEASYCTMMSTPPTRTQYFMADPNGKKIEISEEQFKEMRARA